MVDAGMNAWMQRGCLCLLRCLVRALGIGLDGRWSVAHRWGVHANKFTPFPHPSIESATFVVHCHVATVLYPSRFIVIKPQEYHQEHVLGGARPYFRLRPPGVWFW